MRRVSANLFIDSGADFSSCGTYRYRLWRRWGPGRALCFVMLNPSIANATENDPTVERCQRRADRMGFDALEVVNLFARIATDPTDLRSFDDPIGPGNDAAIIEACRGAGQVLVAWGVHGEFKGRSVAVSAMLRNAGIEMFALGLTKDGTPRHPLYLPNSVSPEPWP